MDSIQVTFACDEDQENSTLKHTKVFQNKNLFQCYHNNRGYCSFGDQCRYQHFKQICSKNICTERECNKRHPVLCRYKDECKFYKKHNCAFRHIESKKKVVGEDIENQIKIWTKEIENLKVEIIHLKEDINTKEKELSKSKMEIMQMNIKHTLKPSDTEKDLTKENDYLKKQIEILQKENEAMKIKLIQKDQTDVEKSVTQPEDKGNLKATRKYSCKKCCLNFPSKENLNKHENEMHKLKLTF